MKAKSIIFFYVALLPSIINGDRNINNYEKNVEDIAKEEGRIEGIFQPEAGKYLGYGRFSFVHAGILFPSETRIAMKFTLSEHIYIAKKEYEMYTYLDAINNPTVERYGIPSVYYFGKWNEHSLIMMGISLLDQNIADLKLSRKLHKNDVNVLIIIRDFIISSKYMHSRGVRHDNIFLDEIMVRGHRSFLIDFNFSSKMNQRSISGNDQFASRRAHTGGERYPKDDWESFLYSICFSFGVYFDWMDVELLDPSPQVIYGLKLNTSATKNVIKNLYASKRLKRILFKLSEHVFDDGGDEAEEAPFYDASNSKRFPDYNLFYNMVNEEIEKLNLLPTAMFKWLTPEQKEEAIKDFNEHGIPKITEISDPKDFDFSTMNNLVVDFNKFSPDFHEDGIVSSSHHA